MKVRLRNPDRVEEVPGPATVAAVLARIDIDPQTVLVIHEGTLVTGGVRLPDDAEIEVRPVISGGAGPARCRQCRSPAVLEVARNRAAYCAHHLIDHVRTQVRAAVDRESMLSYDDRVLVAVSGGKDSLALWDVLLDMGYRASGLYLGLGIGGYSQRSERLVVDFADRRAAELAARGARLHLVDLADAHGFTIPGAARGGRSSCGTCGLSKRYVLNQIARTEGYDVLATGHNLDDEASQLLGNVVRWQTGFMARQAPSLPASDAGLARKVKPLYRLTERETAAYCVVKGIDYVVEECPLVAGNTILAYKEALNLLERQSPGTKAHFLFTFLDRTRDEHFADADADAETLVPCDTCEQPTTYRGGGSPRCAFCRTRARLAAAG